MQVPVLISTYSPYPTLSLSLPGSLPTTSLHEILAPLCPIDEQYISTTSGHALSRYSTIQCLRSATDDRSSAPVTLRLSVRMRGGKGGFASQLRAQGGRMTSNRATNKDSCRDLSGRRLSTVKEAERLAKYLEGETDRKAAKAKAAAEKLEKLKAEIKRLDENLAGESAASSGGAGGATGASTSKRKLDDHEFVEQSREMVENVRDAVKEAMMRKRKKAKTEAASKTADVKKDEAKKGPSSTTAAASSSSKVVTSAA